MALKEIRTFGDHTPTAATYLIGQDSDDSGGRISVTSLMTNVLSSSYFLLDASNANSNMDIGAYEFAAQKVSAKNGSAEAVLPYSVTTAFRASYGFGYLADVCLASSSGYISGTSGSRDNYLTTTNNVVDSQSGALSAYVYLGNSTHFFEYFNASYGYYLRSNSLYGWYAYYSGNDMLAEILSGTYVARISTNSVGEGLLVGMSNKVAEFYDNGFSDYCRFFDASTLREFNYHHTSNGVDLYSDATYGLRLDRSFNAGIYISTSNAQVYLYDGTYPVQANGPVSLGYIGNGGGVYASYSGNYGYLGMSSYSVFAQSSGSPTAVGYFSGWSKTVQIGTSSYAIDAGATGTIRGQHRPGDGSAPNSSNSTGVTNFDIVVKDGIITSFTVN